MESAKGTNGSVASGHEADTYLDTRQAARYLDVKSSLLRDLRSRGIGTWSSGYMEKNSGGATSGKCGQTKETKSVQGSSSRLAAASSSQAQAASRILRS